MAAFVDRKLFIHNLGHAATAYFGYQYNPEFVYLYEPLTVPELLQKVRACMLQSAAALNATYPRDLPIPELLEHIEDLLQRFQNRALGDTIYRVGRDLPRKLDKEDRLIGAMLLAKQTGCACDLIAQAVLAACSSRQRRTRSPVSCRSTFSRTRFSSGYRAYSDNGLSSLARLAA